MEFFVHNIISECEILYFTAGPEMEADLMTSMIIEVTEVTAGTRIATGATTIVATTTEVIVVNIMVTMIVDITMFTQRNMEATVMGHGGVLNTEEDVHFDKTTFMMTPIMTMNIVLIEDIADIHLTIVSLLDNTYVSRGSETNPFHIYGDMLQSEKCIY